MQTESLNDDDNEWDVDLEDLPPAYQSGAIHRAPGWIRTFVSFLLHHKILAVILLVAFVFYITGLFISVHELTGTRWAFYIYNACTLTFAYAYTRFALFQHMRNFSHGLPANSAEIEME